MAAIALASREPSLIRRIAASAAVSGIGGAKGKRSMVPSIRTNGIRRGFSHGRSAMAYSAMIARMAQPSR